MRFSWKWLSEQVDLSGLKSPQALADLLVSLGLEVESIEPLDKGFEKVVTARILEKNPHPQSDRLSLCRVTVDGTNTLEIVCGAQNMKAGDIVALAQIGANLPNGIKIGESKIRGVASFGMLCSEEELQLKEKSEGILILPSDTPIGQPLAKILDRNDILFVLKITANRGDCLSHRGIAREIAAALNQKLKTVSVPKLPEGGCPVQVSLQAGELCPQFHGCWIEGVQIGPSPAWLVKRLETLGSRSINNVVDATNLVLLELGQPMHAYDGDLIQDRQILVRISQSGEELPLLDGTTVQLTGKELVIADSKRSVALAGVMGGGNSEVRDSTKNLFLECAEFDARSIRKTSTAFQRKTDAAHRFERGIDPEGLSYALARLAGLIVELAGGKIVGSTQARLPSRGKKIPPREIRFGMFYLHDFLGFSRDYEGLSPAKITEILNRLECQVRQENQEWVVIPPSYRLDLNIREDIAEEIARSLGYDALPATLPPLTSTPVFSASALPRLKLMDRAKDALVKNGLYETLNLAFTHRSRLARFGFEPKMAVLNPLSEEHEVLVPSLLPGLVQNALDNSNHHFGSEPLAVRLFELRPVFSAPGTIQSQNETETGVEERWKLGIALSGPRFAEGLRQERGEVDFYDLKAIVDNLLAELGARGVRFLPMSASRTGGSPHFHPGQTVEVLAGNSVAGYFGLLHPKLARELKVKDPLWLAELDWEMISRLSRKASDFPTFQQWPMFPTMERDFALLVKKEVTAEKICQLAIKAGKPIAKVAKVFDIYQGSQVAEGMTSVAVRVILYEEGRSLQESETEAASTRILESWKKELGAELRG